MMEWLPSGEQFYSFFQAVTMFLVAFGWWREKRLRRVALAAIILLKERIEETEGGQVNVTNLMLEAQERLNPQERFPM